MKRSYEGEGTLFSAEKTACAKARQGAKNKKTKKIDSSLEVTEREY